MYDSTCLFCAVCPRIVASGQQPMLIRNKIDAARREKFPLQAAEKK